MLASLLPGLRDVRTPLATGYLWLLALWFLLHDVLPKTVETASGPIKALFELGAWLGSAAVLAAISFAAYLIGCLVTTNSSGYVVVPLVSRAISELHLSRSEWLRSNLYTGVTGRQPARLAGQLELVVRGRIESVEARLPTLGTTSVDSSKRVAEFHRGVLFATRGERLHPAHDVSDERLFLAYFQQVFQDFPAVGVQLQAKNRDLWDTYDRHSAESQFRRAIALPILVIVVLIAIQVSPFWLLLLVIPIYLPILGIRQALKAESVLVQAITLRMVEPPVLERLEEHIKNTKPGPITAGRISGS